MRGIGVKLTPTGLYNFRRRALFMNITTATFATIDWVLTSGLPFAFLPAFRKEGECTTTAPGIATNFLASCSPLLCPEL